MSATPDALDLLVEFQKRLGAAARSLSDDAAVPREGRWREASDALAEAAEILAGKLHWEISTGCRAPWLAMLAGGTNVGKSEIFNALARDRRALPDERSAQTKHPLAYVHRGDADLLRASLGDHWRLAEYAGPEALNAAESASGPGQKPTVFLLAHDDARFSGVCLFDAPDVDSDLDANRETALRLMRSMDAVVYVALTEKYNDRLCVDFLRACANEGRQVHPIFNFASDSNKEAQEHFRAEVLPKAFEESKAPVPEPAALPFFREGRHDALTEAVGPLRDKLFAEAVERVERKRQLARRLGAILAERMESLKALSEEADAWRLELDAELEASREEARQRLAELYADLPFSEQEEIFRAACHRLAIPYVDQALQAVADVAGKAAGMFGWRGKAQSKASELRRQRRDAEDAASEEIVGESAKRLDAFIDARPDHPMAALAKARRRAKAPLSAEASLFPRTAADAEAEEKKIDAIKTDLADFIENTPGMKKALMGGRIALLAACAAAPVTGGLSLVPTLVLGSAAATGANQLMIEGARKWVERRRGEFFAFKAERAAARLEELHRGALKALASPATAESARELADLAERLHRAIDAMTAEESKAEVEQS